MIKDGNVELREINSFEEYIDLLKDISNPQLRSGTLYFRGQTKRYNSKDTEGIMASAYRDENSVPFEKNVKEYYRYTAPSLSSLELENYIAFCQHHGLRTPLIDITTNPLVALYFAVKDKEDADDSSVIYIFKESQTIDITPEVTRDKYGLYNIWDILCGSNPKALNDLYGKLEVFENHANLRPFLNDLYRAYQDYKPDDGITLKITEGLKIHLENLKQDHRPDYYDCDFTVLEGLKKEKAICQKFYEFYKELGFSNEGIEKAKNKQNQGGALYASWYLFLLHYFMSNSIGMLMYPCQSPDECFKPPRIPNTIYRPTILYDRMKTQSGAFIYQCSFLSHVKNTYQEIYPDIIVKINKSSEFLEVLKLLKINQASVFPDADNIASHLNSLKRN